MITSAAAASDGGLLRQAGITMKILSGDNPETVSALAQQAGLWDDGQVAKLISGAELAELDDVGFAQATMASNVFGRVTPEQKERVIRSLRDQGQYVAMAGDGVNDVLALKQAQVSIAMQSGSQATRSVADLILIGDSLAAFPLPFWNLSQNFLLCFFRSSTTRSFSMSSGKTSFANLPKGFVAVSRNL
jgi:cation-transporting ATPase E